MESGSVHSVALLTVGTLACRAIGVGPIGIGSLAVQALGALLVVKVVGMGSRREWLVRGLVVVGSSQLVVIRRRCLKVSPPFGGVVVPKVGEGMWVFLVLVLVGFGLGGWFAGCGGAVASWACPLAEGTGSWCSGAWA